MGLDMSLTKYPKIKSVPRFLLRSETLVEWGKDWQIFNWFENHLSIPEKIENMEEYEIQKETLEELRDTCREVLKHSKLVYSEEEYGQSDNFIIEDSSCAKEKMPYPNFFDNKEYYKYDEYYIRRIADTYQNISFALEDVDFDEEVVVFSASW